MPFFLAHFLVRFIHLETLIVGYMVVIARWLEIFGARKLKFLKDEGEQVKFKA